MFDTRKVAQRIREARNAQNMTQMALADAMDVSYQAVSNWERGNSMPDISKLEQLCNVLHITIYELLGAEDSQSRTVSRILRDEELPSAEEVAEIAPIVPPQKLQQAAQSAAEKKQIKWDVILSMAPFISQKKLGELVDQCEQNAQKEMILALAPFLNQEQLERLVRKAEGAADEGILLGLAPFLSDKALRELVLKQEKVDWELTQMLAPFLNQDTLDELLSRALGETDRI